MNQLINNIQTMTPLWFIVVIVALILITLGLIKACFINLKMARIISNTPSSKIRSAAQGFVELEGVANPINQPLRAPLTGKSCCWYSYSIEQEVTTQNDDGSTNTDWDTIDFGESSNLFSLTDLTGICLVNTTHAKTATAKKESWSGSTLYRDPQSDMSSSRWERLNIDFGANNYRYTEHRIEPGEHIFILGYFLTRESSKNPFSELRAEDMLTKAASKAKAEGKISVLLHKYADIALTDLNSRIKQSSDDWDYYVHSPGNETAVNYISHQENQPCIVSSESQKKLIGKYRLMSGLSAFGALIVAIIIGTFIFYRS